MNREETLKIFSVIKANYGNFFKSMTKTDAEAMVSLWEDMFSDEPYELVGAAVKSFIASDVEGYPPNVGKIKEHIKKLTEPDEMTEQEAANLIFKALSNSIYNSESEFEKLPPTLQTLVGSPNMLREWAMMDSDTVHSVISSNLMRSYRNISEREKFKQALPSSVKNLLAEATQKLCIEEGSF